MAPPTPASVAELRRRARSRLPRMAFDFIDGGAGDERGLQRNEAAFAERSFVPRVFRPLGPRSLETELFGRRYAAPFGVSPMGLGNLAWPGTDLALARAAAAARIPYSLSCMGSTALEDIAREAAGFTWFQIYPTGDPAHADFLVDRAEACGIEVLILTVDANVHGRRRRNTRNRFALPFRWTLPVLTDLALHPRWSLQTLRAGAPDWANYRSYVGRSGVPFEFSQMLASMAQARLDWDMLARLRERWRGRLIVKGVLHPDDARRIADEGADGIVVSNHGARQLGSPIAAFDALAAIREAVGSRCAVLLDSGVRSGEDIAKALAAGADFVLLGRAFLFASAAMGPQAGADAVIGMLNADLDNTLAQLGCRAVDELGPELFTQAVRPNVAANLAHSLVAS